MHLGIKFSPKVFKDEQLPVSLDKGKMSQLVSWLTSMDYSPTPTPMLPWEKNLTILIEWKA